MSRARFFAGATGTPAAPLGGTWQTVVLEDFIGAPAPIAMNANGPWVLASGATWQKENTGAELAPPTVTPGTGLVLSPANQAYPGTRNGGLIGLRLADLGIAFSRRVAFRMSMIRGGIPSWNAGALFLFAGLEVCPPNDVLQRENRHITWNKTGAGLWNQTQMWGTRNNAAAFSVLPLTAGLTAFDCARITYADGPSPLGCVWEMAQSVAGNFPPESAWQVWATDGYLGDSAFSPSIPNFWVRGGNNAWGVILTAYSGDIGGLQQVVVTRLKLELVFPW